MSEMEERAESCLRVSRSVVPDSLQPMDCSPPGSSVHGIFQTRILEWFAISFSRGSSPPRDQTRVLLHCRQILANWATAETVKPPPPPPSPTPQETGSKKYFKSQAENWKMSCLSLWIYPCTHHLKSKQTI